MSQLSKKLRGEAAGGQQSLVYLCPGCRLAHVVNVGPGGWSWNGDVHRPTFMPAILVERKERCHGYVTNGQVQFLPDSTHALAGQLVGLPDWEAA